MAKAKRVSRSARVKKKWFPIVSPKLFGSRTVGETFLIESEKIIGRMIPINLSTLTRNMKQQNITVYLNADSIKEGKVQTSLLGFHVLPSSMKRMARRDRDKVGQTFTVKTSDGAILVKSVIITRNKGFASTRTSLRKAHTEAFVKLAVKLTADALMQSIFDRRIQMELKKGLNKIAPLRSLDITYMRIVSGNAAKKAEQVVPADVPKEVKEVVEAVAEEKSEEAKEVVAEESPEEVKKAVAEEKSKASTEEE